MTRSILLPLLLAFVTAFGLIVLWELWAEQVVFELVGIPFEAEFEVSERWHFILVATAASLLSLILPAILLGRGAKKLRLANAELSFSQQQAQRLARHDALTGLPNRRVFREKMAEAIKQSPNARTAVFLIDLDRFKPVNDLHGHQAGDVVLCEVAERLASAVPPGGIVSRLGGDEFAMTLPHISTDATRRQAQKIIKLLGAHYASLSSNIGLGASIGIAICGEDGSDPQEVLRAADLALYRAKREGRNSLHFFEADMDDEVRQRARLEGDLRSAIMNGRIVPWYQPIIDLRTQKVAAFEILSRWTCRDEAIPPDIFIPVTEDIGLMDTLTSTVLRRACRDAAQWPSEVMLSLNISPAQLQERDLPERIMAVLSEMNFAPSRLQIEVTEDALVSDFASARHVLQAFADAGIHLALDDYGTGYSSLYHLRELKFRKIKIDRSFIAGMSIRPDNTKMVEAMLALGASLGLRVTAEGVESPLHAAWLASCGCDEGQGFFFGRPMPGSEVLSYLAHGTSEGREPRLGQGAA